jgi:hypothetical protein
VFWEFLRSSQKALSFGNVFGRFWASWFLGRFWVLVENMWGVASDIPSFECWDEYGGTWDRGIGMPIKQALGMCLGSPKVQFFFATSIPTQQLFVSGESP